MGERYQVYPEYKDSGVEWFGTVPDHWEFSPLKYLCRFNGGGTPSKDKPEYWNGDIPWVSPKDMNTARIFSSIDKITQNAIDQSSTNLITEGAVLIVVRSGILKHSIPVAINDVPVTINQDMKALRFGERVNVEYAKDVIMGHQNLLLLEWGKQGATVESIEQEYLANTYFPVPPLHEQKQIARFLDHETTKIDTLIEKQQQLITLLKEKRQAVISHAVTKGLNPDAPMKDSGVEWLGEVPEHWVIKFKLLNFAENSRGSFVNGPFGSDLLANELTEEGVPVIYIRDLKYTGYKRKSTVCVTEEKANQLDVCKVSPGDILIAKVGDPPGETCVYPLGEPVAIITQDVIRIRLNREIADCYYLAFLLNSDFGKTIIDDISVESTRKRISLGDFKSTRFFLPPLGEQISIVNYVNIQCEKIDHLIEKAEIGIGLAKERRTALISAAVTGKIDVRTWQPTAATPADETTP